MGASTLSVRAKSSKLVPPGAVSATTCVSPSTSLSKESQADVTSDTSLLRSDVIA